MWTNIVKDEVELVVGIIEKCRSYLENLNSLVALEAISDCALDRIAGNCIN